MTDNPFEIKDRCRQQLGKYLIRALSMIPHIENPLMIDLGCGTGVPTLILAGRFNGTVVAVDENPAALSVLNRKIEQFNIGHRVLPMRQSVFNLDFKGKRFDIVLAEGLLNITGFERGLSLIDSLVKNFGYVVLHDDFDRHHEKINTIVSHGYRVADAFELDEKVWWVDYYCGLERNINLYYDDENPGLFENDLKEITQFHKNPKKFRSVYYVLEKQGNMKS